MGYGGTKTEMERLIKDASAMTQEQKDLNMTVDAGSMSFDNIVRAIQVVQKHQGIYGTTAKEAMHTIEGSMNATKAAWQNLITEIGKPDADIGARLGDMVTAIMGENGDGGLLNNVTKEIKTVAGNVGRGVATLFSQGLNTLAKSGPSAVKNALNNIGDAIERAWTKILDFRTSFDIGSLFEGGGIADRLTGFVTGIGGAFAENWPYVQGQLEGLMEEVTATVQQYGPEILSRAGQIVGNIGRAILKQGPGIVGDAAEIFMGIVDSAAGQLPNVVEKLGEFLVGARDFIVENGPAILESIGEILSNVGEAIVNHGPSILASIGNALSMVGNAILEHGPEIVGKVVEVWYSLLEWLTANGPTLVDKVAEIIGTVVETAWQWIVENGPRILEAVIQIASSILTSIMEHGPQILGNIATIIGDIVGYIGNAATELLPAAVEFMGGLITGTSEEGEKLYTWFSELPQRLLDALGDLSTFLVDAGTQIIQGFWDGLTSKWDEVSGWVGGLGSWIAENKGPKAYDLGLLVPNGEWIMQSLESGLQKGLPSVERTLADITDSIQTGINTNVSVASAQPQTNVALMSMLGTIRDNMDMKVYLDSGRLVGGIAPQMNVAMGRL